MPTATYKKYRRDDQKALAVWAAKCAERVLPLFECAVPDDDRPRQAIEACREWVRTGIFKMAAVRSASLGAHAAARAAKESGSEIACLAARAAGQAMGTPHVTQHAYGAALYALKAVAAVDAELVDKEFQWQSQQLPRHLRSQVMSRLIIVKKRGVQIKLDKSDGF